KACVPRRASDSDIFHRAVRFQLYPVLYCRVGGTLTRRHVVHDAGPHACADLGGVAAIAPAAARLVAISGAARHAGRAQCIAAHGFTQGFELGLFLGFFLCGGLGGGCFFLGSGFFGRLLLFSCRFLRRSLFLGSSLFGGGLALGLFFGFFLGLGFL